MKYTILIMMAVVLVACEQEDPEARKQRKLETLNVKTEELQDKVQELRTEIDAQSDKQVEKIESKVKKGSTWEAPPFPSGNQNP